jgi:HAD superfamily hydrolase (TIGR01509 family)
MISAIIFDLDGTIIETEDLWNEVFEEVAIKHKIETSKVMKMANGWWHEPGLGISANWRRVTTDAEMVEKLSQETWKTYKEKSSASEIRLKEGAVEVVQKSKEKGWMTALCTGSTWNVVEAELEKVGMYLAFDVTTTGEEAVLSKPDPEIYLLTAQKLGIDPKECLVVEDAIAGIRAAAEAEMTVVGIVSGYALREEILASGAKYAVESLSELAELLDSIE